MIDDRVVRKQDILRLKQRQTSQLSNCQGNMYHMGATYMRVKLDKIVSGF